MIILYTIPIDKYITKMPLLIAVTLTRCSNTTNRTTRQAAVMEEMTAEDKYFYLYLQSEHDTRLICDASTTFQHYLKNSLKYLNTSFALLNEIHERFFQK
jgi:hypothetical protein